MDITSGLIAAGVDEDFAPIFNVTLSAIVEGSGIDTPRRMAAFLANVSHESNKFTRTTENLMYTTEAALVRAFGKRMTGRTDLLKNPEALANVAYANRLGNGDEASGDGWKYRGRGYLQLTGRSNYRQASMAVGRRYDMFPEDVSTPEGALLTAVWFWTSRHCPQLADAWALEEIRERINGPSKLGQGEVAKLANKILKALE